MPEACPTETVGVDVLAALMQAIRDATFACKTAIVRGGPCRPGWNEDLCGA